MMIIIMLLYVLSNHDLFVSYDPEFGEKNFTNQELSRQKIWTDFMSKLVCFKPSTSIEKRQLFVMTKKPDSLFEGNIQKKMTEQKMLTMKQVTFIIEDN